MRFHIRRLVSLAVSSTCVAVVIIKVLLSPDDVRRAVPPVQVNQKQLRPVSDEEGLVRDRTSGGQNEHDQKVDDVNLSSENVPASLNEHIRHQYVHLPKRRKNVVNQTLWWSRSVRNPEDRIQMQMRHLPRNYRHDHQRLKTIYMPGGLGNEPEGQEKFIQEQCPVSACSLTSNSSVARTAEMRLLQGDVTFYFADKPAGQIWTMFLLESPANIGPFSRAGDLINWTATYRWDSTLVTPYEKFVPYRNTSWLTERLAKTRRRTNDTNVPRRNYAAGKTKMVAWFVSNCASQNKREEYANELAEYAFLCLRIPLGDA